MPSDAPKQVPAKDELEPSALITAPASDESDADTPSEASRVDLQIEYARRVRETERTLLGNQHPRGNFRQDKRAERCDANR